MNHPLHCDFRDSALATQKLHKTYSTKTLGGQYLLEQHQYMNERHCAAASHAKYWADRCFTAETANAAGTATTAIIPVPATANEPLTNP